MNTGLPGFPEWKVRVKEQIGKQGINSDWQDFKSPTLSSVGEDVEKQWD